jgi:hypothetical protein
MTRRRTPINDLKLFSGLLVIAGLTICCATRSIAAECAQWAIGGAWEMRQASGIPVQFEVQQNGSTLSGKAEFSEGAEAPPAFCKTVLDIPVGPFVGCYVARRFGKFEAVVIGEMKGSIKGNEVALNVNWHRTPVDESRYRGTIDSNGHVSGNARWTNGQTTTTDLWNFSRNVQCVAAAPPATAASPPVAPVKPLGKVPGSAATSPGPAYEEASQNFDILGLHNRPGNDYTSFETTGAFGDQVGVCAKTCLNDQRCKAWAYVRPGFFGQPGGTGRCWLKDNVPAAIKDQCCFAGVRKTTTAVVTATVIQDVEVYDACCGNGNKVGADLRAGATVTLLSACADNWCHVSGPAVPGGTGWVYDGPDYDSLQY